MGDVAMTVPIISAVTEKYPEVQVTVLTKKLFMPIFDGMERVQTFEADVKKRHKGLIGLWRLYQELKPMNFDAVADLHNVLRSRVLKKYFALERIPIKQIDKGRNEKKALNRAKNKVFQQLKSTHQRYADVFTQLGFPIEFSNPKPLPRIQLSEKVLGFVHQDTKKWVGIAPFAAHEGKMYPLEYTEEVIKALDNTNKYKILLFGGGTKEVEVLTRLANSYENALCMAGKLNLSEELQLISNLDVMLSMDSGNAHLAANYGIPVITLWGVTHPFAGFYPFGQPIENALFADREKYPLIPTSVYGNKVPKGYENAMKTIDFKLVEDKLLSILEPPVDS
ncbi:heptosyltransferase [Muricauda sp. NBRC 101325]|nr:heptosyltransferase [Muricauda sp. NBRC 101325]